MRTRGILGGVVSLALALAFAPGASAQAPAPDAVASPAPAASERGILDDPEPARIRLKLRKVQHGKVDVGDKFKVVGRIFPFVEGQQVTLLLKRDEKTEQRKRLAIQRIQGSEYGRFSLRSRKVIKPGTYRFRANKPATPEQQGALAASKGVDVDFPNLNPGDHGPKVKLFNKLLTKEGFHTSHGSGYGSSTSRAVLAFRKTNNMARTMDANQGIYKALAAGKGGFKVKWKAGGKHVEADLSRQVMALIKNGKPKHVFHISSGTAATPTVRGKFSTYSFQPGFNSKGMYYSVYFHGGYATHGYASVPTYPASHGCLRNPIPDSVFIYKWLDMGDVFYVYG